MSQMTSKRGVFIVLEGVDGSGKSTQVKRLADWLNQNGLPAAVQAIPDRTTGMGKAIDAYLKGQSQSDTSASTLSTETRSYIPPPSFKDLSGPDNAFLTIDKVAKSAQIASLFAFNRWEVISRVLTLLSLGVSVVCDRYVWSGIAYAHGVNGVPVDVCEGMELGLPIPDLTLFVDRTDQLKDLETFLQQTKRDSAVVEVFETANALKGARRVFREYSQRFGTFYGSNKSPEQSHKWVNVDGNQPLDDVTKSITEIVSEKFQLVDSGNGLVITAPWVPERTDFAEGVPQTSMATQFGVPELMRTFGFDTFQY